MATGLKVLYEFGPFQVDPDRQVLLRENQPVAITPKAFETLLILVRHSREVVSKDELMKAVWPDSFVEETSLSQNIFRLRKALGDATGDPRYIVTLPGRGYRFAAQVREVVLDGEDLIIGTRSQTQMIVEQTDSAPNETPTFPDTFPSTSPVTPGLRAKSIWKYALLGAAVLAVLVVAAIPFLSGHRHKPIPLNETDSVLLADFTNTTGDAVFDGTLQQGLEIQLQQSPFLSLVSEERVQQTLRMMGQPADVRLTSEIAREVCERTASAAVLDGSIAKLGSQYVLGLRAKNCRTGEVLAGEQAQAARKEDVLNALSEIASKFRARVGESLTTVKKYDTPLAEGTTPLLEALKAYSVGWKVASTGSEEAAEPFFKHAAEIDPKFAMAYASLGLMYGSTGESAFATENITKAWQLRDRASDNEKFFITAYYDGRATGNQEKAQQTCETWAQVYPRDATPHAMLAGFIYPAFGKYEEAAEAAERAIQLGLDFAIGYVNLGYAYVYLDRPVEAEKALQRASDRKIEAPWVSLLRYDLAFMKDDKAGMEREVALARGESGTQDWIFDHAAFVMAYSGHLQEARRKSQRAVDFAQESGHREKAALFETRVALRDAFFGNAPAAKRSAMEALALARNREVQYGAAFALALSGDSSRAQTLANDLEKNFPEDTAVRFSYMPSVRALLALNHGDPAKAIELLQIAVPNELGQPRSAINGFFGALYPVYVRGQAYLASRQDAQAAGEFQRILDHRGTVVSDPISVLAHLQLGRAYALSGDTTRAKVAYHDFLTLWKDADPDIPILKQAKAEYAKLN
jgi:DNA-binding winged helix-turn-helix (wHTH) protein/tetratricopeptide (TPR) repeat protein